MGRRKGDDIARFWSKVKTGGLDQCWIWQGSKRGQYGGLMFRGKRDGAHRVSYLINCGEIPEGIDVLHRCDNPLCVNPAHLFLGTHADNMHDMKMKGRAKAPRGERANAGKLTAAEVLQIRELLKIGLTHREIAACFGVSQVAVTNIHTGATWKHLA